MIHVEPAAEPEEFDARVRQPGGEALRELIGETPTKPRPVVIDGVPATRVDDLPPEKLPDLWTRALDDMLAGYGRICAYVAVYIERVTGAATIDHWIPKSRDPHLAYEWSNYRLGCSKMNGRKSVRVDLVDPFEVRDGDFSLELVGFQVLPGVEPDHPRFAALTATIDAFKLNDYECCALRGEYFAAYRDGDIGLSYLETRAPFVAREVRRQGWLRVGDAG